MKRVLNQVVKQKFHELFCILKLSQESATNCSEVASGNCLDFSDHRLHCHVTFIKKSQSFYLSLYSVVFGEAIFPLGRANFVG